jgi:hypothetical protein
MKLLRIKVEQLRQFRQPFELSGLEPGLNLFTGPNEAGKSTVVRAIRAAFFERHRSSSVEDLLPWGEPSATPTVEIDFSIHDRVFSLKKSFLKKGRCELHKQDGDLDGEAAEQYLAELLGFEFPGRGSSKPEHWGIPGLLWIEQGTGQDIAESVGNATDHLRKALDRSVSDVSSGVGDEVINKVRKQRDALLTNNGRPRAAYAEAIDAHSTLLVSLEEMDRRIDQYQRQVDQLGNLLAEDAADNALPTPVLSLLSLFIIVPPFVRFFNFILFRIFLFMFFRILTQKRHIIERFKNQNLRFETKNIFKFNFQ